MRNYTYAFQDTYINTCVIIVFFPSSDLQQDWTTEVKEALILNQITMVIMSTFSFYASKCLLKNW